MKSMNYESPVVEVLEVEVEKGFATSSAGGDIFSPGGLDNGDTEGWEIDY